MVMRSTLLFFALFAPTAVYAQDKPRLPQDVPPTIGMATAKRLGEDAVGGYQIELVLPSIRYEIVHREHRAGKVASWHEVVTRVEPVTKTLRFQTASQIPDSVVVGIDGKPLTAEVILERLAKQTPVLVSVSGHMVDPYYLQLAKKEAVIILLSRKDGKGDMRLLPEYEKGLSTSIQPVIELTGVPTTAAVYDVAKRLKPIKLETKEEAANYFKPEALTALVKQVDFNKQFVLIFAWKGSGQDKLTYDDGFGNPAAEFRLKPGRTRDLRPHVHVYALGSNVEWDVVLRHAK